MKKIINFFENDLDEWFKRNYDWLLAFAFGYFLHSILTVFFWGF